MKILCNPEEVGSVILFLASSSYITGNTLMVDGVLTAI